MNRFHPYGQTAVGCGCLSAALAPVVVVAVLDLLGALQIENGLLIALWLFLTLPPGLLAVAIGLFADRRASARGFPSVSPHSHDGPVSS